MLVKLLRHSRHVLFTHKKFFFFGGRAWGPIASSSLSGVNSWFNVELVSFIDYIKKFFYFGLLRCFTAHCFKKKLRFRFVCCPILNKLHLVVRPAKCHWLCGFQVVFRQRPAFIIKEPVRIPCPRYSFHQNSINTAKVGYLLCNLFEFLFLETHLLTHDWRSWFSQLLPHSFAPTASPVGTPLAASSR